MTMEIKETQEMLEPDEFDVLLDDVLRTVANPEIPQRLRVKVRTRVWVREMVAAGEQQRRPSQETPGERRVAVVYSPQVFLARMEPKRDARSTVAAILLHAAAILLIFWTMALKTPFVTPGKIAVATVLTPPPDMGKAGGGGQKSLTAVTKGKMPKIADLQKPKITMPDPTVNIQKDLKMSDNNMPQFGDPNSPLLGNSMGRGSGGGMGNGTGMGIGSGVGNGVGVKNVGGGVIGPVKTFGLEPEFSEEARKAKFMGVVTVSLIVDQHGLPQNVRVLRGVGMGLDDKAVEAVKTYRFKPATENGKPVAVYLNVEVNFEIF
jgi:protein TonB